MAQFKGVHVGNPLSPLRVQVEAETARQELKERGAAAGGPGAARASPEAGERPERTERAADLVTESGRAEFGCEGGDVGRLASSSAAKRNKYYSSKIK